MNMLKKLALMLLAAAGCGDANTTVFEAEVNEVGECVFRYPPGSNTETPIVYKDVVAATLDAFTPEAITLTFVDGSSAIVYGFGSVHCYPYQNPPVEEV